MSIKNDDFLIELLSTMFTSLGNQGADAVDDLRYGRKEAKDITDTFLQTIAIIVYSDGLQSGNGPIYSTETINALCDQLAASKDAEIMSGFQITEEMLTSRDFVGIANIQHDEKHDTLLGLVYRSLIVNLTTKLKGMLEGKVPVADLTPVKDTQETVTAGATVH